jgi:hypothetical protein
MTRLSLVLCVLLVTGALSPLPAQPSTPSGAISVYLDCQDGGCDFDFFRTEITFVNWVRDRQVADVHMLVSSQQMGSGGREFTVTFMGLARFAGLTDTLVYAQPPASTEDERRRGLARTFRAGLVRYVARTDAASRLTIAMTGQSGSGASAAPKKDPWNNWVFRIGMNSWFNGEETYKSAHLNGNLSADRITAKWKTRVGVNQSYSENKFELDSVTTFVNIQRRYGGNLLHAYSLGEHWSVGTRFNFSSSTYDNFLRAFRLFPAIEYNVFPYSQSTRRQIRLEYNLGFARFDYRDTTIFDRIHDQMPVQRLIVSTQAKERWGSVDVGVLATSYLHDTRKYRIAGNGEVAWRIFKGLNLNVFGGYEYIQDQFFLAKKNFTPEQILTRQFRLPTNYYYWGSVGLSYTFGSILNNIVNPRFGPYFID